MIRRIRQVVDEDEEFEFEDYPSEEKEGDFYNEEELEHEVDNGEIKAWEQGFVSGWKKAA